MLRIKKIFIYLKNGYDFCILWPWKSIFKIKFGAVHQTGKILSFLLLLTFSIDLSWKCFLRFDRYDSISTKHAVERRTSNIGSLKLNENARVFLKVYPVDFQMVEQPHRKSSIQT